MGERVQVEDSTAQGKITFHLHHIHALVAAVRQLFQSSVQFYFLSYCKMQSCLFKGLRRQNFVHQRPDTSNHYASLSVNKSFQREHTIRQHFS